MQIFEQNWPPQFDDGVKNTDDYVVDNTASQVSSEANALEGGSDVLGNANFAQKTFSNTFSPEGIKKYSELAGHQ